MGWAVWVASKTAICDTSITYGHQFEYPCSIHVPATVSGKTAGNGPSFVPLYPHEEPTENS